MIIGGGSQSQQEAPHRRRRRRQLEVEVEEVRPRLQKTRLTQLDACDESQ